MKAYQGGSHQERTGRAAEAKQKALDLLKARPAVDEATLAARRDAALARETAQDAKRAAARTAKADKEATEAAANASPPAPTEEERKAMRDARYAARKSRK